MTFSPTYSQTLTPSPTSTHTGTFTWTPTPTPTLTQTPTYTITPTPHLSIQLSQNFFSPVGQTLEILGLAEASGRIRIDVYNLVGEKVRHVADWSATEGLPFRYGWDGRNHAGQYVGNGVYVIMMRSPKGVTLKKVIVLK